MGQAWRICRPNSTQQISKQMTVAIVDIRSTSLASALIWPRTALVLYSLIIQEKLPGHIGRPGSI